MVRGNVPHGTSAGQGPLLKRILDAYVKAGSIELSLDQLAKRVGVSKRMLVHYFGSRDDLEAAAMTLLEEGLRAQFSPQALPTGASLQVVIETLWGRTTAPESRGVLRLVMDLSRRAWSGSPRARSFYAEQQELWAELLLGYLPHRKKVEEVLLLFQGAVLAYLVTGDPEPGRRALARIAKTCVSDEGRTSSRPPRRGP